MISNGLLSADRLSESVEAQYLDLVRMGYKDGLSRHRRGSPPQSNSWRELRLPKALMLPTWVPRVVVRYIDGGS